MANGRVHSPMRKPTISVYGLPPDLARSLEPIKQSLEIITGSRAGMEELKGLGYNANMAEVITKLNEIMKRLNASGRC